MYAPDDPFAVRRPAPPVAEPGDGPAGHQRPTEDAADEPDIELHDGSEVPIENGAGESDVELPNRVDVPADDGVGESDIELLDRAEATFAGASRVIDLVERGDLDQAESLLDSLVAPSSE